MNNLKTTTKNRTDINIEQEAIESFDTIAKKYKEYLRDYYPVEDSDAIEPLLWIQAEILGHMIYMARPLGYHRRKAKELEAEYVEKMRKRRAEFLDKKMSAAASEARAKAEFSGLDAESKRHESIAEELSTLYKISDSARFVITQHIKNLQGERMMVQQDIYNT